MGWRFELKHANTVAYLTVPTQQKPPRLTTWELLEFLGSLQGEYRERPPLFSSDPDWVHEIVQKARVASKWVDSSKFEQDAVIPTEIISHALGDLRASLSHYDLYGLAVGTWEDRDPLHAFAEHAAYSSKHNGLFLIPDLPGPRDILELFDPSPVAKKITSNPDSWPGILFWVRSGEAAFVPLEMADGFYHRLLEALQASENKAGKVVRVLKDFNARESGHAVKRLLHLSDLHFGTHAAINNQAYLSSHLKTKLGTFQRVVITGDLFDNPKERDALTFRNFRSDLEATTGKELIVIPGNHDQKRHGNSFFGFGRRLNELTKLEWSSLVIDDDLQCVFYCFDSSRDAPNFARGNITREQMIEVATQFETKVVTRPELKSYLSVALVHHHPYSFETHTETPLQKSLHALGVSDETFLKMEGADEFLSWCAGRRVSLVLHGHKHVPRHVRDSIKWTHGKESEWREVTAIGCGTSLGAENMPLSYNVLEWSPKSQKWSASFFADPGIGTGFEETYVALHSTSA